MAIATGADCVGQQHAIEPAMDNAVAGTQTDTATGTNEIWQLVVHLDIHWLGICRRMAEGLHHQVGTETEAGKVFQLVARHRAGCVL